MGGGGAGVCLSAPAARPLYAGGSALRVQHHFRVDQRRQPPRGRPVNVRGGGSGEGVRVLRGLSLGGLAGGRNGVPHGAGRGKVAHVADLPSAVRVSSGDVLGRGEVVCRGAQRPARGLGQAGSQGHGRIAVGAGHARIRAMAGRRPPPPHPAQPDVTATRPARIPALINSASGNAAAAREALGANDSFDVREVAPDALNDALDRVVAEGAKRVLVAGGDGTIATAAHALLPTDVELAILPGGTLNHFARNLGISTVPADALITAVGTLCCGVDVGLVNGTVFLNTSSVGAYVRFVRVRELLEPRFGYRIASALAALRVLFALRLMAGELEEGSRTLVVPPPPVFFRIGAT